LRAIVEPDFYAHAAARHGAVFKLAQFHRPVACVVGLAAGHDLLRRCGDALRPPALPLSDEVPRGFLRYMVPADHARYSRLFRAAVSEATLRAVEPFAVATTTAALAALARASREAPTEGVRPQAVIEPHLHAILLRLYFGDLLQPGDDAVIAACGRDADVSTATGRAAPRAVRALRRFEDLLTMRAATYDPSSDPSIWGGLLRLEPDAGRDPTVLGNLFLLLEASQYSIGGMLGWMFVLMGTAPAWRALVRTRPPLAADDPYARAVLETLRLAQSEYVYREVLRPIPIGDFVIPAGWLLRICVAESHRRATVFPDPDRFDPERHLARRYEPDELAPFGLDLHACLGARMTVLLGRILARALVHDVDWEVLANGPKERGNRHWRHWEPSSCFRIALRMRGEPRA
jgi:cytochrome P450